VKRAQLPENWRDKVRQAIPVDNLPRAEREQFRESVIDDIEFYLRQYFAAVEIGWNETPPSPKAIAKRAAKVTEAANALAVQLESIIDPQTREDIVLMFAYVDSLKDPPFPDERTEEDIHFGNLLLKFTKDLREDVLYLQNLLHEVAMAHERPNPNRRPNKNADRGLTWSLAYLWIENFGKEPTVSNLPDGTEGGPFVELLKAIERVVHRVVRTGYSAAGQAKWFRANKDKWQQAKRDMERLDRLSAKGGTTQWIRENREKWLQIIETGKD